MFSLSKFSLSKFFRSKRRLSLRLLGMAVLAPWCGAWQPSPAFARRPNIVLIVADDLGYRELGCFGQQRIQTPNLDQFARQGMRLTQHYAGNAVCAPSRCVLMTGKHPGHALVRGNRSIGPEGQFPLTENEVTLAGLLQKQGYATGAFGKWGLGGPGSTGDPLKQGFQRFFGYNCQVHAHSYYPGYLWDNAERLPLNNNPPIPGHASLAEGADPNDPASYQPFKGTDYAPDRINQQALHFIRDHQQQPFFLYYPTIIPHLALHIPDEELAPYLKLGWNDPPLSRKMGDDFRYTPHRTPRAAYAAMITQMDRYVGKVLRLLDELGLAEDTIVIFSSDNGTSKLSQEVDVDFFASVGELRGLKGMLYEGGIRVPTIVRWPGHIAADSVSDRVSGFEDWLPTILELASGQASPPSQIDGISLVPTLEGKAQPPRPLLYREFAGSGGQQSLRVGDWKAVRNRIWKDNRKVELYHLKDDVGEQHNVAQQYPDRVAHLANLMEQQHRKSPDFPLGWIDD